MHRAIKNSLWQEATGDRSISHNLEIIKQLDNRIEVLQ